MPLSTSVGAHNRCRKLLYYIGWSNNWCNKWCIELSFQFFFCVGFFWAIFYISCM